MARVEKVQFVEYAANAKIVGWKDTLENEGFIDWMKWKGWSYEYRSAKKMYITKKLWICQYTFYSLTQIKFLQQNKTWKKD